MELRAEALANHLCSTTAWWSCVRAELLPLFKALPGRQAGRTCQSPPSGAPRSAARRTSSRTAGSSEKRSTTKALAATQRQRRPEPRGAGRAASCCAPLLFVIELRPGGQARRCWPLREVNPSTGVSNTLFCRCADAPTALGQRCHLVHQTRHGLIVHCRP